MFNHRAGTTPQEGIHARFFFVPGGKQAIKEPFVTPGVYPASPEHAATAASRKLPISKIVFFALAGLLVIAPLYFLTTSADQPHVQQFGRTRAIQLDVQNGTGEPKLAQKLTEFLRAEGFDVVELGNYKSSGIPQTLVIDRTGNREAAKFVAASLGVTDDRVVQRVDKNLFLDVTVVIGKDFASLKAFQ